MPLDFVVLDVFTDQPLAGNPLAVVLGADDLDGGRMLAIAREFNLSETVFVLKPRNPAHSARIRIFTPAGEVPFAGHPTVGTAILLAQHRVGTSPEQEQDVIVVMEEEIGIVRCGVVLSPGGKAFAEFDVPKVATSAGPAGDKDMIAAALGLTRAELGFENHKPCRFDAGLAFTFVPVHDLEAMAKIRLERSIWHDAFPGDERALVLAYCRETLHHDTHFHARMFGPLVGIDEDPATGSAAAAFAGVVRKFDEPRDGTHRVRLEQGIEMGRPSIIDLEFDIEGAKLRSVRIGGGAVRVSEGVLTV
ncbi:MAG TPA: PhzF family phenazine biosynthesis protein [Hyphomicrobiales bacterium]|nr:PhzF family phenazine biosynthesis protein [Hyphomicrobiales bacterium]